MNDTQSKVVRALEAAHGHVFVSGEAGTGKSVVLREFVASSKKKLAVCAPTGLAAANVGGVTIHSLFRLPIASTLLGYAPRPDPEGDKVLSSLDAIVIDEASMVRADMLDAIDAKLRVARESEEPFGGTQMLMFGDLLQLPPVQTPIAREALKREYDDIYFFNSNAASSVEFTTYELVEVMRQTDPAFISALRAARIGRIDAAGLATLNTRVEHDERERPYPVLATVNETVDKHNAAGLDSLGGKESNYFLEWRGDGDVERPEEAPCDRKITLKVGCPVLFTRNDPELGVSNGTAGTVIKLKPDSVVVKVGRKKIKVEQASWAIKEYVVDERTGRPKLQELGEFLQYPLRLGFALTVHRSQGQTYERATIDFADRGPFANGQGYVAVSRVRSLEGLALTRPLRASDFKASRRVLEFLRSTRQV